MLSLRMNAIARGVYLNAGGGTSLQGEDVGNILKELRSYSQLDALDHI